MTPQRMTETPALSAASVIALPRGVRLRFDAVRGRHVLLAPERVLFPCETSVAVLETLATPQRLDELVRALADQFEAPEAVIEADIRRLIADLADQHVLQVTHPCPTP